MAKVGATREELSHLRSGLVEWYGRNRRDLPWRRTRDPYAIWVSEIMLQQTRVAVVVERFEAFMECFPTVFALAAASEQDVLALWSGLGYYRRARMLHKAAQVVANHHQGHLPMSAEELRTLPGIGGYTSAAIASIAHGEPVAVVDGNVERVLCRLAGWNANGGNGNNGLQRKIEKLAGRLVDPERPGDFNQAMMELGATICLPRNPQCLVCPLSGSCQTRGEHKTAPRPRSVIRKAAYALCVRKALDTIGEVKAHDAQILLEQRPAAVSVMPGLWELPAMRDPDGCDPVVITVRHAIMNVNYVISVHEVDEEHLDGATIDGGDRRWVPLREAGGMALTGLTRKVLTRLRMLAPGLGLLLIARQDRIALK